MKSKRPTGLLTLALIEAVILAFVFVSVPTALSAQGVAYVIDCGQSSTSTIVGQAEFTATAPDNTRTILYSDFGVDPATINGPVEVVVYFDNDAVTAVTFTSENGASVMGVVGDHFVTATLPNDGSSFISATATIVATPGRTAAQNAVDVSFFGLVPTTTDINSGTAGILTQDIEIFNECAPPGTFPVDLSGDPNETFTIALEIAVAEVEAGDTRTITFTFTACGQTFTETVDVEPLPNLASGFGIYETSLTNIPGDCDEIGYEFCSGPGEQSYGVGFVAANYNCVTCFQVDPDLDVDDVADQAVCAGTTFPGVAFTADDITVLFSTRNPGTRDLEQQFTWQNSNPAIGLASSGSGPLPAFTAVNSGTTPITATISVTPFTEDPDCEGSTETFSITVNPAATLGNGGDNLLCVDQTDQLVFSGTPGTFTSSNGAVVSVSGGGLVTGVGPGDATITYTDNNGCVATTDYTVTTPSSLAPLTICVGDNATPTITPARPLAAVNLSSSDPTVVSVNADGTLAANAPGTATITFTDNNGCTASATATVPEPPTVADAAACVQDDVALSFTNTPASFTSSDPGVATVSPAGIVTGQSPGSATITLTDTDGCEATAVVTVNPLPELDNALVCVGDQEQLNFSGSPGSFSSDNTAVATVTPAGIVTGQAAGSVTIAYTDDNNCTTTATVTVNPLPTLGDGVVCVDQTVMLVASTTGTFTSLNPTVATVNGAGVVTGVSAGSATIQLTDANGCTTTASVTVNPLPELADAAVCVDQTITLSGSGTAAATDPYVSAAPGVATVTEGGVVSGVSPGTAAITYTDNNGCSITATVTVNALPTLADAAVCLNGTVSMIGSGTPAAADPYQSADPNVASVTAAGEVTGIAVGSTTITYTDANGCQATATVTVNALPILEGGAVCVNESIILMGSGTPAVDQPYVSADPNVATVNAGGTVTGVAAGTTTITYTDANGCQTSAAVTVNALPTLAGGMVCLGQTITLTGSGTPAADPYASSNEAILTVDANGVVTGVAAGTATVTYTNANGCRASAQVTVNALPTLSGGEVCVNETIQLSGSGDGAAVDPYQSDQPAVATVDNNGLVTGVSAGSATITYTDANGCQATATVEVNPLPTVSGGAVCVGDMIMLTTTNVPAVGNPFASSNPSVASVMESGIVEGLSPGSVTITFTDANGCQATSSVTVNALPTLAGGEVCVGDMITLAGSGTPAAQEPYQSSDPAIATVEDNGAVTGLAAGSVTITYTDDNGCSTTAMVTVNALPVLADANVCLNETIDLSVAGSTPATTTPFVSSDPAVASVDDAGIISGLAVGSVTITYTDANGCTDIATVRVDPLPTVDPLTICQGETDRQLTFTGTPGGFASDDVNVFTVNNAGQVNGVGAGSATVTFTDENGCQTTATVTVNANPTVNASQNVVEVCNGEATPVIVLSSDVPNAVFMYAIDNPAVGLMPAAGTGNVPSFTAVNNTADPVVANVTVTTTATANGQECSGAMTVIQYTIEPTPTVNPVADQTLCAGGMTTAIDFSGAVNGTEFAWTNSAPEIGLAASGTGDIAAFTALNAGDDPVVATIMVTPRFVGLSGLTCTGPTESFTITVNPTPTVDPVPVNQQICLDGMTGEVIFTGAGAGAMFSYTVSGDPIGVPADPGNGSLPAFEPTASGTAIITVTPITPGTDPVCTGTSVNFTVRVDALPVITGPAELCAGESGMISTAAVPAMTDPFVSSDPAVATVSASGTLSALAAGQTTITFTDENGCTDELLLSVNPLPVLEPARVCAGSTVMMVGSGDPAIDAPYTSANSMVATVDDDGLVTGQSAGTTQITYTDANGCMTSASITVDPLPTLTGGRLCQGDQLALEPTNAPAATDPFVSDDETVATVTPAGLVTAQAAGSANVTYTDENGCQVTATITVDPLPTLDGGEVCVGATIQLSASGMAASVDPYVSDDTDVATVTAAGVVTGVAAGSTTITYTDANGCMTTAPVTVNALPTIDGEMEVCLGDQTTLTGSGTPAATAPYESSAPGVATVDGGGVVTGVAAGTTQITYTDANGCQASVTLTVLALPMLAGGEVCVEESITLTGSNPPAASMPFVSSDPEIATVNDRGVVTGVMAGEADITFTDENGCTATASVTVNALPTLDGGEVCVGESITLTGSGTPAVDAPYTSADPAVASVTDNGIVVGVAAGSTTITYTDGNGCMITAPVTVNALPTLAGGEVCVGSSITLSGSNTPATNQPYVSSMPTVATVDDLGIVTGVAPGTTMITYTDVNGCMATATVTVNALPSLTGGSVCEDEMLQLTFSGTPAATSSFVSDNPGVATVTNQGVVTGISAGSTMITYTDDNGCSATAGVTVNELPEIFGPEAVCVEETITLTGSGTAAATMAFVSEDPTVASVTNDGEVTGLAAGEATIVYTDDNGCTARTTVTVNALPTLALAAVCLNETTTITGSGVPAAAGPYSSANENIATVDANGVVTGVAVGMTIVTYTDQNGCSVAATVTVNGLPSLAGAEICLNEMTTLMGTGSPAASNPYVSSDPSVARVLSSGVVTGQSVGSAIITYTDANGCTAQATVVVNPLPTLVGGEVCVGTSINVNGSGTAATQDPYLSSDTDIATVDPSGSVTGVAPGSVTITYTDNNGCQATTTVTVNAPPTLTGEPRICIGQTSQLTASGIPFTETPFVSGDETVATVDDNGLVTGQAAGTTTVTYTDDNGCRASFDVTVDPGPTASTSDAVACVDESAVFTAMATANAGGELTYQWQMENADGMFVDLSGEVGPTLTISRATADQDGDRYRVIVTETTSSTSCTNTDAAVGVLTVNPLPVCDINGPGTVNANDQDVVFSTTATNVSYQWSLEGGDATIDGPSDQQSVTIDFGTMAPTIVIQVTDAEGCTRRCELPLEVSILSLGSTVFHDINNNGIQDPGEPGIPNVPVELYAADGDILILTGPNGSLGDADDGSASPVLTDNAGNYFFTNLVPGDYYVSIPGTAFGTDQPLEVINISSNATTSGFTEVDPDIGNVDGDDNGTQLSAGTRITSGTITLTVGEEPSGLQGEPAQGGDQDDGPNDADGNMTLDLGVFAPVTIGDTAFVDVNGNNLQDADDLPLGGVTVTVFNADGTPVTVAADGGPFTNSTMTAADGSYLFTDLPPGEYFVVFDLSTADNADLYVFVTPNVGNDLDDSDAVPTGPTTAQTGSTGILLSGEQDLFSLDVGVVCNISVTVPPPATVCATAIIDLQAGSEVVPASLGATWSAPAGDGTFIGGTNFRSATGYRPGANDRQRGRVTLVLTTDDPATLSIPSGCQAVSTSVTFEILQVDCGAFFWDGGQ